MAESIAFRGTVVNKICRRKSDGRFYEPSHPDDAVIDLFNYSWYFREVELMPRRWWQLRPRWKRTGEIWEPDSGEFDVLEEWQARQLASKT